MSLRIPLNGIFKNGTFGNEINSPNIRIIKKPRRHNYIFIFRTFEKLNPFIYYTACYSFRDIAEFSCEILRKIAIFFHFFVGTSNVIHISYYMLCTLSILNYHARFMFLCAPVLSSRNR